MIRKFCDICNKEIEMDPTNKIAFQKQVKEHFYTLNDSEYEVCPSCLEKVENYINILKKNG